jgi:hypothetical protein
LSCQRPFVMPAQAGIQREAKIAGFPLFNPSFQYIMENPKNTA